MACELIVRSFSLIALGPFLSMSLAAASGPHAMSPTIDQSSWRLRSITAKGAPIEQPTFQLEDTYISFGSTKEPFTPYASWNDGCYSVLWAPYTVSSRERIHVGLGQKPAVLHPLCESGPQPRQVVLLNELMTDSKIRLRGDSLEFSNGTTRATFVRITLTADQNPYSTGFEPAQNGRWRLRSARSGTSKARFKNGPALTVGPTAVPSDGCSTMRLTIAPDTRREGWTSANWRPATCKGRVVSRGALLFGLRGIKTLENGHLVARGADVELVYERVG